MPPAQEELLLTDIEQTHHQWVQGLKRKQRRSQDDFYFNKPGSTCSLESLPIQIPLWAVWAQNKQDALPHNKAQPAHAEVGISQVLSDSDGEGIT